MSKLEPQDLILALMSRFEQQSLPLVFSKAEFCKAAGISLSNFHRLERQGKGPPVCRVGADGKKVVIRREDAERWLLDRREEPAVSLIEEMT